MDAHQNKFTDWTYVSYEKIQESPSKWKLSNSDYRAFKKTDWVVTEKIHGANFCITTNGEDVRFAKRKEFLQLDEDFFDYKTLKEKLVAQVQAIFKIIQKENPRSLLVSVYGELFGGEYPHPDVPPCPHVQAVQTGIYYSPKIEYCAFDIAVLETSNLTSRVYQDYDKALKIFQQVGMMGAKPLFIGRYEEALAYKPDFPSTIPALLELPNLPVINKAEGIVIKPIKSIYIETTKGRIRPILKIKIPEFAEDSRFHQATKWTLNSVRQDSQFLNIEKGVNQVLMGLVTEMRLKNVISKTGKVSAKDNKRKKQVIELLVIDVLETFKEDYKNIFDNLPKESQSILMKQLNQEAEKLVDSYLN
jgi:Rnl2 family RNA ligase